MEKVKQYFIAQNAPFLADRIRQFSESTATVELAAQQFNCKPAEIAKSLGYVVKRPVSKAENKLLQLQKAKEKAAQAEAGGEGAEGASDVSSPASPNSPTGADRGQPVIIVVAGDARVTNKGFKDKFGCPPKMFKREEVEDMVGFPPGGVCPFGVNDSVKVYLDVSLKRFEIVYPACGTTDTGVPMSMAELEKYATNFVEWVDMCDGWRDGEGGEKKE